MTTNPKSHDPLRSLDAIEPPDRWFDVIARAKSPADTMESPSLIGSARRRHALLLAAAAVVVVVALVAGITLAVRSGDGDRTQNVAAGPGEDPPTAIWGRTWQVTRIVRDGKDQPVIPGLSGGEPRNFQPLRLDATHEGSLSFNGCNDVGGSVRVQGDRIEPVSVSVGQNTGCLGADSKPIPLQAQDAALGKFLRSGVKVSVSEDDLTLRNGVGDEIDLTDEKAFDPPTAIWGRTFTVTRLVIDAKEVPPHRDGVSDSIEFSFTDGARTEREGWNGGWISMVGCNRLEGPIDLQGDVLQGGVGTTQMACEGDPPAEVQDFFGSQPIVQLRKDKLVLRSGTSSIEAVDPTGPDPSAPKDSASTIWGRTWRVTHVLRNGEDQPAIPAMNAGTGLNGPLRLDATKRGILTFNGCNGAGGTAQVAAGRVQKVGEWFHTLVGCGGSADTPLVKQDDSLNRFLSSGVEVAVSGDKLTLANDGGDEIDLIDEKAFDPPSAIWNRTFIVTRLVDEGKELSPKASRGVPVHLRFALEPGATSGAVETIGQSGSVNANPVEVRGDLLGASTPLATDSPPGEFDVPEVAANRIVVGQPIIQLRGDNLVLRTGTSSIEAVDSTASGSTNGDAVHGN